MSTEDERRARRAERLSGAQTPAHTRVGTTPSLLGTQGPTAAELEQLERERAESEVVESQVVQLEVIDLEPVYAVGEPSAEGVELAPQAEDDAPDDAEDDDDEVTVRHDVESASDIDVVGETPAVEGDRPVMDDGKAAGEAMRQARQQRGRPTPRHGHGWLDVDAFTDYLRTARLRPIGTGQGTVNVRVSAQLVNDLEKYRGELAVSKRDVVEALLVELLGPSMPEGGRR